MASKKKPKQKPKTVPKFMKPSAKPKPKPKPQDQKTSKKSKDPKAAPKKKKCPKCGFECEATREEVDTIFGYRTVRDKEIPQSYCKGCRQKPKKVAEEASNTAPIAVKA